tara:strand:- start:5294 stop:5560 length:267 start_codon:yes stop_codon:yes gene_type:complete
MPAKTYKCNKCGDQVSKPKSVSVGEGKRICRSHAEADGVADKARQAETFRLRAAHKPKFKPGQKKKTPAMPPLETLMLLGAIMREQAK